MRRKIRSVLTNGDMLFCGSPLDLSKTYIKIALLSSDYPEILESLHVERLV
jgi:hypothetical protein